jgi:predicted metalloprotease
VITEATFSDEDLATGGDIEPDQLLELVAPNLDAFYARLFAGEGREWDPVDGLVVFDPAADEVACGTTTLTPEEAEFSVFYCPADDTVQLDGAGLVPALQMIGDFAIGAEVARQWAFAAQDQLAIDAEPRGIELHADCLSGLWAGDLFLHPTEELSLSPGDLDEGIISFLATQDSGKTETSPFERSDAFRQGFVGDVEDCDALLG